jgi:hypothetical protein
MRVSAGDSLWSIAKQALGAGASNAQIATASAEIARANGLAVDARLQVGQQLTLPDRFDHAASTSPTTQPQRAVPVGERVGQAGVRAKPLAELKAVLVPTTFKPVGPLSLPPIAGVAVDAKLVEFVGVNSIMVHSSAMQSVVATFGRLDRQQFDAVHAAFGGRSAVVHDANRSYSAADFLPPAAQALLHQDLEIPKPVVLKNTKTVIEGIGYDREDLAIDLTMNCHATAWEMMRAYAGHSSDVSVFYGEMVRMDALTDTQGPNAPFTMLKQLPGSEMAALDTSTLKPGDLIQFHLDNGFGSASTNLLHSAVYVGGGLFFEKPNTEGVETPIKEYDRQDETPFRLCTPELLHQALDAASDGKYRVELKRPNAPLAPAASTDAFGSSSQKDVEAWAAKKGRTLGATLVVSFEQGMGGNIRNEYISGLATVPLQQRADGTTALG